jgi:Stress-induced morphogen (activity unknown)
MTTRRDRIVTALTERFAPEALDVIDESHRHEGHAGARPGGETHYRVKIVAPAFAGTTRLAAHRLVNDALADEFATGLHALAIEAKAAV